MSVNPRTAAWAAAVLVLATVLYVVRVRFEMADFTVYRTVADRALAAAPLYLEEDGHYQFKYLPAFALAMAPLAFVGLETAKAIWFALSLALLWSFVAWSLSALPDRRLSPPALAWVTVILMGKFYAHELNLGQSNILLGVLLVLALRDVISGHARRAGALVGIAVFVKPYAAILLPWLLPAAGPAALASAAVAIATGLVLPALVYGWRGNLDLLADWWHTVTASTAPNLLGADNISFAAMWAKWLGVGTPASLLAAATAVAALAVVAWVVTQRRRVHRPAYLEMSLLLLLVPLISPQGWDYVLLLATPALVCLVDRFREMVMPWRVATAVAIAVTSFTIYDLLGRALYARMMAISLVSVGAIGLFLCLVQLRRRGLA